MRVLLDTNVVVSALLFGGPPRALLHGLCAAPFELWTSRALLRELAATLSYGKLQTAVTRTGLSVEDLVNAYAGQTFVIPDAALDPVDFPPDPSDALVISAALATKAEWLVTGDRHLLGAAVSIPCPILSVTAALDEVRGLTTRQGGERASADE